MDTIPQEKRSWNMGRIRAKNTKPERIVAAYLRQNGIGYRKHVRNLPGTPDFVLTRYRAVIFVNGCFWHGHEGCRYATVPKTRTEWWLAKFKRNQERDTRKIAELESLGWRVFTIWECELKDSGEYHLKMLLKELLMPEEYGCDENLSNIYLSD